MTHILEKIVAQKRIELERNTASIPADVVRKRAHERKDRRPFFERFSSSVVIAEIKPRSPSHGALTSTPLEIAALYAQSDADCISVLTDEHFFGGSLELLETVRVRVPQAILRKDFVIDPYMVYEAGAYGADAVLLIAAILDDALLRTCIRACDECALGYIVEVHTAVEVQRAIDCGARVIGINNRNLDTLTIDLAATEQLAPLIPPSTSCISESGIQCTEDVARVRSAGARGVLVGAALLRAHDVHAMIRSFKQALQ